MKPQDIEPEALGLSETEQVAPQAPPARASATTLAQPALAPLLRGIGSSILLAGALIGYVVARQEMNGYSRQRPGQALVALPAKSLPEASKKPAEGNGGTNDENLAERVVENPWFEFLGFVGMAVVSSSFYVEYLSRRNSNP